MPCDERAAGAVVVRTDETMEWQCVLVCQHDGDWGLPKGHVEPGESDRHAATREVKEEAGLSVELDPDFHMTIHYIKPNGRSKEVVYFLARSASGDLVPQPEEIVEIGWFSFDEAVQKVRYPAVRDVLRTVYPLLKPYKPWPDPR